MECGRSSNSHNWHSILIYERKKTKLQQPLHVYSFGLLMTFHLGGESSEV